MFVRNILKNCCGRNNIDEVKSLLRNCRNDFISGLRYKHKAAFVEEFGKPLVIKETTLNQKLKDKEVRIAVKNCGVNISDLLISQGKFKDKVKTPFIPGFEISGEVLEVGSGVDDISEGDRIVALNKEILGGFAEECIASENDIWKIPQNINYEDAAALTDSYATALIAARRVDLKPQDTVLVTAAAGGLGLAAVDVFSNLFNAKVLGICGTEDRAALVRDKGAFSAMTYKETRFMDVIEEFTDGKGVKVVFDAYGGDIFKMCLKGLSMEGSLVVAGFASQQIPDLQTSELLPKSCSIIGVSLTQYRLSANETFRDSVQEVIDLHEEEYIEPHVSAVFKLDEINEAFKFYEDKKSTGKVVIDL
ncbi:quinone oxidoreductase-like protein 2 homolog [Centruroides vittatus]|uniref:quinone oxidoreductase-like protein 2 homolog n=1 Tax=Centruroides vittatus TaxID=120091 RepID=UPI00350FFC6A